MQSFAARIFFQQHVLAGVEKSFGTRLTEETARLGFAPVLSPELQII
jgi:hypothetical protein